MRVNQASVYIEEKNGNKFLIFDNFVNENEELKKKKYADVWDGIKSEIKAINVGKENDYGKDYIKIKFNSDDDLSLNKPLKFHAMTIIIRSLFEKRWQTLSTRFFLHDALYELWKCYNTEKLTFQKELMLTKQVHHNNVSFAFIGTLKMLHLNFNHMFVTNVTMYWWLLMS